MSPTQSVTFSNQKVGCHNLITSKETLAPANIIEHNIVGGIALSYQRYWSNSCCITYSYQISSSELLRCLVMRLTARIDQTIVLLQKMKKVTEVTSQNIVTQSLQKALSALAPPFKSDNIPWHSHSLYFPSSLLPCLKIILWLSS